MWDPIQDRTVFALSVRILAGRTFANFPESLPGRGLLPTDAAAPLILDTTSASSPPSTLDSPPTFVCNLSDYVLPGHPWFFDLPGPLPVGAFGRGLAQYAMLFVDAHTRVKCHYLLKNKSDALIGFQRFFDGPLKRTFPFVCSAVIAVASLPPPMLLRFWILGTSRFGTPQ